MIKNQPIDTLFWNNVRIGIASDCWEWEGSINKDGYGILSLWPDNKYLAHRLAYELTFGSIDDPDINVHHQCENKLCCNPGHLLTKDDSEHSIWHDRERARQLEQLYGQVVMSVGTSAGQ